MIQVECTWGDGPDILVSIKGEPGVLLMEDPDKSRSTHGTVNYAQLDLTAFEAMVLAKKLMSTALEVVRMEEELKAKDWEHQAKCKKQCIEVQTYYSNLPEHEQKQAVEWLRDSVHEAQGEQVNEEDGWQLIDFLFRELEDRALEEVSRCLDHWDWENK